MTASVVRHIHHGLPFTDDDASIAAALEDVSIPVLLCSLVHLTGDPQWVRGDLKPAGAFLNEYQGYMSEADKAEARRRALPVLAAYRDRGCPALPPPAPDVLREMMHFLLCAPIPDDSVDMFVEDLQLDGPQWADTSWADSLTAEQRSAYPVLIVGCGEAGLLAGVQLRQAGIPFTIVEKNAGPGGTWFENTYPGARVDIGSHFYTYACDGGEHWSEYFVQHAELQRYFEGVLDEHGVRDHCRFQTEVTALRWNGEERRWHAELRGADGDVDTLAARVVVSAVGSLNRPKLPDIPGMDDFAGPSFHSARWDHSVDYRGRRVAQIGAGASGFQIAPTIAPDVTQLTVFQRTAQWMFPNPNYHRGVPAGDAWAMRHLPFYGRWFRLLTFLPGGGLTMDRSRIQQGFDDGKDGVAISEGNRITREFFTNWIISQVGDDPDLQAKVIPDYPASGKRTLQDNGSWLSCLTRDNVELVRTPIERIVADGVVTTDGRHYPADIICYATGFRHNDFLYPMEVVGRSGRALREVWGDEPTAHLGITVPDYPNLFCLYGPGTNLAHGGNLIYQSECQMRFVLDGIRRLITGGYDTVEVTQAAYEEYAARYRSEIDQMVWSHPTIKNSHYKNPQGKVFTLSPWPTQDYWRWTHSLDPADYTFTPHP